MFEAGFSRGATRPGAASFACLFSFSMSDSSCFCCFCHSASALDSSLAAYWCEGSR